MLDIEEGDSLQANQTAKPTRRRRGASRPAGAPVAADTAAENAVPQTKTAAEATTSEPEVVTPPASEPPAPRRRRRSASRPAGAPADVATEADTVDVAAAATPEPAQQPVVEPEADSQPPAKTRRTRKRATAKKDAAPVAEAPTTPEPEEQPTAGADQEGQQPTTSGDEPPKLADTPSEAAPQASEEAAEPTPEGAANDKQPARSSKGRGRKRRAAERPAEPAVEPVVEPIVEPVTEPVVDAVAEPAVEEAPEAESDVVEDEAEDSIVAALRMAEAQAASRKPLVADPFALSEETKQRALDELAGAIAQDGEDSRDEARDEASDGEDAEDSVEDGDEAEEKPSRSSRRRRRGGRRRRRSGGDEESEAGTTETDESEAPGEDDDSSESSDASEGGDDETQVSGRRRRRRRRRGSVTEETERSSGDDEITGIEGSTRMAAKRQRRKENRAAGRRRAPILSEAEFLARRESVDRKMVIRQNDDYTQIAVIEDDILVEHYVDRASSASLIGNVYLGRVQNVLPSMEAAFIDIGRGRNAVLYAGEVDWDSFGVTAEDRKVEKVFKSGQTVLVQVTKDPVGAKGARLTGHISLPGRYIVYSPGGHLSGISRKLPDTERNRLRDVLADLISDDESVIVRTAAEGVSAEELVRDVNRLKAQWEVIEKKVKQGRAPQVLHSEPDLTLRIVRDLFTEDFSELIVQGNGGQEDAWESISAYVDHVAPHLKEFVHQYEAGDDDADVFAQYRVDEQISKALDRKVYLPSGGSLVIDRTEAMTVVDVNTGKFTGSGGNLEATVTSNNLEAAEELVRQLRLRDLGGIIVVDFIDMVLPSNRELLLRRLVECLARDRTRHQVSEVTSLGLVQLTRKRIGTGLAEAFTEPCDCCDGSGYHRFEDPVDSQAPADGGDRRNNHRKRKSKSGRN